jgi:hypothetical protein
MQPANLTFSAITEQLTRALGEAVIRIWSNLPREVQNRVFQRSGSLTGRTYKVAVGSLPA